MPLPKVHDAEHISKSLDNVLIDEELSSPKPGSITKQRHSRLYRLKCMLMSKSFLVHCLQMILMISLILMASLLWHKHMKPSDKQIGHSILKPTVINNTPGIDQNINKDHTIHNNIHVHPYKSTGIRLPIIPNYGSNEYSRFGYDHIYMVHEVGHPERLRRMTHLLQLLQLSAEFVPLILPKHPSNAEYNKAEWDVRYEIYKDMARNRYHSVLILDDTVDMELNIKAIMRQATKHLPKKWDLFFPGHCGAFESIQPKVNYMYPPLRQASVPICLHAHAVSRSGLAIILKHIPQEPNGSIQMAIMKLNERRIFKSYSMDVPIFSPRLDSGKRAELPGNPDLEISALSHLALRQSTNG